MSIEAITGRPAAEASEEVPTPYRHPGRTGRRLDRQLVGPAAGRGGRLGGAGVRPAVLRRRPGGDRPPLPARFLPGYPDRPRRPRRPGPGPRRGGSRPARARSDRGFGGDRMTGTGATGRSRSIPVAMARAIVVRPDLWWTALALPAPIGDTRLVAYQAVSSVARPSALGLPHGHRLRRSHAATGWRRCRLLSRMVPLHRSNGHRLPDSARHAADHRDPDHPLRPGGTGLNFVVDGSTAEAPGEVHGGHGTPGGAGRRCRPTGPVPDVAFTTGAGAQRHLRTPGDRVLPEGGAAGARHQGRTGTRHGNGCSELNVSPCPNPRWCDWSATCRLPVTTGWRSTVGPCSPVTARGASTAVRAAENLDHVIPRSKGGPHTWENVVARLPPLQYPERGTGCPTRWEWCCGPRRPLPDTGCNCWPCVVAPVRTGAPT